MFTIVRKFQAKGTEIPRNQQLPLEFYSSSLFPMFHGGTLIKCQFLDVPAEFQKLRMRFHLYAKQHGPLVWDWITFEEFNELKFFRMDSKEIERIELQVWPEHDIKLIQFTIVQIWAMGYGI